MTVTVPYEIPFYDVDSLGMVWHGHYYKYFELARTALYRSLNFDVDDMGRLGLTFPVIESQCRYREALRYGQKIDISAHFRDWEYYILIEYRIRKTRSGRRAAYGHTKQAVCDRAGQLQPCVPAAVADIIANHVATRPDHHG
ncbi:MAG: acyl-CoA thioesterase [Gammaproteobacteria bacterium]|nr:acyl-CoA thioesterase [Gammaproteobacteria bacterium]